MENKVINSLIWKFMERFGTVGVQFILQIILARILSPDDYGAIALITVFITVSNVFIQTGFNTALIQRQDVTERDYSSVFFVSFLTAAVCYILLFLISPLVAEFYGMPILDSVLKVLSLILFAGSYNSIQIARISKNFDFRKLFFSSLFGIVISGCVGIFLAYEGFGIWALVYQQLLNQIIITLVLFLQQRWIPSFHIEMHRVKILFKFGYKLLISGIIDVLYNNLYNLVIGKTFSTTQLGYYNRADQFPNLIVYNVNGSIQSVILPAMSKQQDDLVGLKSTVRNAMKLSSYVVFPLMLGLSACSEYLVLVLLTDKWLAIVPMIKLLSISYMLWPVHTANLQAISALGRSDIYLKLEIAKKIIGIVSLIISIPFGILAMIAMKVATGVIGTLINAAPNKKLLNYGYVEQVKDLVPSFLLSILMCGFIEILNLVIVKIVTSNIMILILDVILGALFYCIVSVITKNENFNYLLKLLMKKGK